MDKVKRTNFTPRDKEYLLVCIDKYKTVLENKQTNSGCTNAVKNLAWTKLTNEFNSLPGVLPRTKTQLSDLYKNLKRNATSKSGKERVNTFKTGGGPPEETITLTDQRLLDLGVVRKPLPSKEDSEGFLEVEMDECEKDVSIPCIDPSAMKTTIETSEAIPLGNALDCEATAENTMNIIEGMDINEKSSIPQPSFGSRLLTCFNKSKKRREPSSVKAANALKDQSAARKVQIEEQHDLVKKKLKLEIENQENSEQRAKEHHELVMKSFKRNEARSIREEERAEELHAAKLELMLEKKLYYEGKFQ